jgi:hypothetical protein
MMADVRQRSGIGNAPLGIHRTMSEPVVSADNVVRITKPLSLMTEHTAALQQVAYK